MSGPGGWRRSTISAMRTAGAMPGDVSPSPWNRPRRDDRDGCDGFFESGAVCKTSSRSSRLSRGAGSKVKGAYLRVEIAARQYNRTPLLLAHGGHWPGGGKGCAFPPCPTASVKV